MDAEIKNLRIDRSAKQRNRSGRGSWRWILFSLGVSLLVGAALFVYAWLNTAVEVETVRVRAASTAASGAGLQQPLVDDEIAVAEAAEHDALQRRRLP